MFKRAQKCAEKPTHILRPDPYDRALRRYLMVLRTVLGTQGIRGRVRTHARGPRYCSLGLWLYDVMQLERTLSLAENMALAAGAPVVIATRQGGLIAFQFQLRAGLWQKYFRHTMQGTQIGVTEANAPVEFSFQHSAHAGVFGSTGSGKTETVKTIIHALASTHSPNELGLVILDRHHDYTDFQRLAHLELPIAHTEYETDQSLEWAGKALAHRIEANERNAKHLVVVVDEAALVLEDRRRLAIARRIGEEGRKMNAHLVLATQKPSQRNLPDLTNNVLQRWVGLVDDAMTSARLTGKAGSNCHLLTGKGDFMHIEGPATERVQVALTTERALETLPFREEPEPLELEPDDTPAILNVPAKVGRPPNELQPDLTAQYLVAISIGNDLSVRGARSLGITRGLHELHKPFATEVLGELGRLSYGICRSETN